jgi:hypothetical protein
MPKTIIPPETDDARASESADAGWRRERLGKEAGKGPRKAMSDNRDRGTEKIETPVKSGASSAIGTSAEGMVEDGEG